MVDRLVSFAFGVLHAVIILLLVVVIVVRQGDTTTLAEFGTTTGIGIGAWLAALSWGATAWALKRQELRVDTIGRIVGRAAVAELAAGVLFVTGAFIGINLSAEGTDAIPVLLFALFAAPFAGLAGCLVAVTLAFLDLSIFAATRRILRRWNAPVQDRP